VLKIKKKIGRIILIYFKIKNIFKPYANKKKRERGIGGPFLVISH